MSKAEAEKLVSVKGCVLDVNKHPDLAGVKAFGPKFLGKVSVDSMDLSSYYQSILPYFRSMDRAKEQAISFFEAKHGRIIDEEVKKFLFTNMDRVGELVFLNARDDTGARVVVFVEKKGLQEAPGAKEPSSSWQPEFK